jgi:iron complex outermembrane receptor protein
MTSYRSHSIGLLLAGAAVVTVTTPAFAQDAAGAQADTQSSSVITVTARKRAESLVTVPVAITALSGDQLAARGIKGFNELNDYVPGLRYENSAANRNDRSFSTMTMRGMYPGDSPNRPAVVVFVDGVAIPNGAISGLTDVERVEVVKGPQSAFFGRATFGGAINFVTKPPSLTDYKVYAEGSYASYNATDDKVTVEAPIIQDKLGIRVSGRYYHTDGQYDNVGYGGKLGERDTKSISASFLAKPIEDLKIRGYWTAWKDNDGPSAQAALTEADYNCNAGGTGVRIVGGLSTVCGGISKIATAKMSQNTTQAYINAAVDNSIVSSDMLTHLGVSRRAYQANLSADYDLNDYTISALAGKNHNKYSVITDTYNRPPDGTGYYSTVFLPYDVHNESGELRVASPQDKRLKILVGGNYYKESIRFQVRAARPGAGGTTAVTNLSQPTDYRARTYGIFGSANFDITPKLAISGEARYQWDQIHHIVTPIGAANPSVNLQQTFKSFSPRVILNYKLTSQASLYTSWARGTRPGTFNSNYVSFTPFQQAQLAANAPGGQVPVAVPEEKLNNYEVGVKGEFFDRKLLLLVDGYYSTWRGRQINQNVEYLATAASTTRSTATLTFPNGKTDLWGIEAEATYHVTRQFSFDGTFNWAHSKVLYTQCSECANENGVVNPVGNLMERYPQYSGTFAANYTMPISGKWRLNSRAEFVYTGKQYTTEANTTWLDPAKRVNGTLGFDNGMYRIEVFVRNLTDSKVPSNILRNANPNGSTAQGSNLLILAAPERRTVGVRASVTFQ